jgi:putative ABC transport system permease protein
MRMLLDIVRQSLATLWAHKLRSFLTMFGIAWGVGSLLLLVGLGEGFRSGQEKELATLGQNIMFMFPGRIPAVEGSTQSGQTYYFTYKDYLAIRSEAQFVGALSPVLNREDIRAVSDYGSTNGQVFGVAIRLQPDSQCAHRTRHDGSIIRIMLSAAVWPWWDGNCSRTCFPDVRRSDPRSCSTASILTWSAWWPKLGRDGNNGTNSRIFIPVETMRDLFPMTKANSEDAISFINYQPITKDLHTEAKEEIHRILARRHGFNPKLQDAFEDWDTIENMKRVGKIFDAMDWFLGVVGVVTLGLGAIGIINIMLVSVTERTKEIGLRKALGATYRAILTQFFIEGAFLTAFSGGIGLAIATGFVTLLAMLPSPEGFDTPRIIPASALAAIGSLAIAGIAAGLYPARKAALLPPVEALRQE